MYFGPSVNYDTRPDTNPVIDQETGFKFNPQTGYYYNGSGLSFANKGDYENYAQGQQNKGAMLDATTKAIQGAGKERESLYSKRLAKMATPGNDFTTSDPSYQWRFEQGQQAVERSQAAKGLLGSGNILTALTEYGQGAASQEYGAQWSRLLQGAQLSEQMFNNSYNRLATIAGLNVNQQQADTGQLGMVNNANLGFRQQGFAEDKYADSRSDLANREQGLADAYSSMWSTANQGYNSSSNAPSYNSGGGGGGYAQPSYDTGGGGWGSITNNSTGAQYSLGG